MNDLLGGNLLGNILNGVESDVEHIVGDASNLLGGLGLGSIVDAGNGAAASTSSNSLLGGLLGGNGLLGGLLGSHGLLGGLLGGSSSALSGSTSGLFGDL